ncbi:MAG TPA: SagB/ThcOx family dehydrogenase, partial [Candidatus Acidoferrales bacterium]|nr:SagB/ThcOx family dehydrogenase [Candidatus Acidoferrales bacterium]
MNNREIQAAWRYHNATKHSWESVHSSSHYLDWENQPSAFKIYSGLDPIPLPQHLSSSMAPALEAISVVETPAENEVVPSIQTMAEIFHLSAGITRRRNYLGGVMLFRAAACTGALYHIDLYLVCGDLPGLSAGVYHFAPHDFALRRLREGDCRNILVRASAREPAITQAPAIVVCASTYWRNAWKYQSRAYRHCYWDTGTILANLLASAAVRRVPARVVLGFEDDSVAQLLSLDTKREGVLALAALGNSSRHHDPPSEAIHPQKLQTEPLSEREIDYPVIREMHEASSLENTTEVENWRLEAYIASADEAAGVISQLIPLKPLGGDKVPQESLEEVIQRRGSTRKFARESIGFVQFSTMLERATRGIPSDVFSARDGAFNDIYLIVHAVEELASGAYVFHIRERALELLKEGNFRREAGYLGLEQEIPADCSVNVFFLANLQEILHRFGNRGYRAAQLEASIIAGKLYLAAYALGLGASGLTFFDD